MPRGKPARDNEQVSPGVGHFGLEELQQLPHRGIGHRSRELAVGHHPQDIEVFDANYPARPRQFRRELVLDVRPDGGNLSMFACHFEPLLLIVFAEDGLPGFRIFRLLFLAEFSLQLAEPLEMECERPLVLKPSSIRNYSSLLDTYIHSYHSCRSRRTLALDLDLDTHVPVSCFTRDACPQDLDPLTHHVFALVPQALSTFADPIVAASSRKREFSCQSLSACTYTCLTHFCVFCRVLAIVSFARSIR